METYPGPDSVIYPAVADSDVLAGDRDPFRVFYQRFLHEFRGHFKVAHLRTGWAIMAHDAIVTVAQAIRRTAPPGAHAAVVPARVRDMIYRQHATNRVLGASGEIDQTHLFSNKEWVQNRFTDTEIAADPEYRTTRATG